MIHRTHSRRQQREMRYEEGFTLVEIAIVFLIIGLLFIFTMPTGITMMNIQKRATTVQKMKVIETALANYAAINRRLPCPADGAGITGVELRNPSPALAPNYTVFCQAETGTPPNDNQQTGVVPWATLGLTLADTLDGWDRQITYRAAYGLTADSALDMSACDPVGTAAAIPAAPSLPSTTINPGTCNRTLTCTGTGIECTRPTDFLVNKGFTVWDAAGTAIMDPSAFTGAAYVLISHGENGVGAFFGQNLIATPISGVDGTLELLNHNNGNAVSSASSTVLPRFRDMPFSDVSNTATYFDDVVVRPTIFSLIQRAQLGPRSH